MTNVVKKGANRASHNAKTAKAAQRTPLPPRGKAGVAGKGVSAKAIKDEVDKKAAKKAAKAPATRIRKRGPVDEPVKSVPRGRKQPAVASAGSKGSPSARKTDGKASKAAPTTRQQGSVDPTWPGAAKGQAFIDYIKPHGWSSDVIYPSKTDYIVTSMKGGESIIIKFFNGRQDYSEGNLPVLVTGGGRRTTVRNVGACRGHADGSRPVVASSGRKVAAKKRTDEDEPDEDRVSRMSDINLNVMDEDQFLLFVAGRQVSWKMPGLPEQTDRVLPAVYCPECQQPRGDRDGAKSDCHDRAWKVQKAWKVENHPRNGKRIFHFTSAVSQQYRAVYVDAIVDVA